MVTMHLACDPCIGLDCLVSEYDFRFRVIDQNTGEDLFFGTGPSYDKSHLRLYGIENGDTLDFVIKASLADYYGMDSLFETKINRPMDQIYLQYPEGSRDRLIPFYSRYQSECCGLITDIHKIIRNDTEVHINLHEVLVFRK